MSTHFQVMYEEDLRVLNDANLVPASSKMSLTNALLCFLVLLMET